MAAARVAAICVCGAQPVAIGAAVPRGWTALVLSGQRPGRDRLADHFGAEWKALVEIDGEAMLTRVVRTLSQSPEIGRIVIVAQPEAQAALMAALPADADVEFAASGASISASISAIAGSGAAPWPVFVTTADHPLLTPAMVGAFLNGIGDADLAVGMVERATLRAAYPENQRTWLRFADGAWSGANMFALTGAATSAALTLWANAEQDRKQAWKLFLHFGPWLALRALTRTIGLGTALRHAGRRLGLEARLIDLRFAEAAIDVDKPSDHDLAEAILRARG